MIDNYGIYKYIYIYIYIRVEGLLYVISQVRGRIGRHVFDAENYQQQNVIVISMNWSNFRLSYV